MKKIFKELWGDLPMWFKITSIFLSIFIVILIAGCAFNWKWYPQDNIAEEIVEGVIEQQTGLDLDLSPQTPEK